MDASFGRSYCKNTGAVDGAAVFCDRELTTDELFNLFAAFDFDQPYLHGGGYWRIRQLDPPWKLKVSERRTNEGNLKRASIEVNVAFHSMTEEVYEFVLSLPE